MQTMTIARGEIKPAPQPSPEHHVTAGPLRRTKTNAELVAGAEWYELYDRQFPGVLAVVRPT